MPERADVVIVGAGIVGASVAWHLGAGGCTDVVLVERHAHQGLGATGKSMGGVRAQFATDVNIRLSLYSIPFYARFEAATGFPCSYRPHGYLLVATRREHLEYLRESGARQRALGLTGLELLAADGVARLAPMLRLDDVVGGSYCPTDGFVDPYLVMTGFTEGALARGARLVKRTAADRIEVTDRRVVAVHTSSGRIATSAVVLAAGVECRPLAGALGVDVPVHPLRRMLVPTEPFPGIPERLPMVVDLGTGFHFRPEARGLLLGWDDPGSPPSTEAVFDPGFVERILVRAAARVPAFADLAVNPSRGWAGLYDMSPDRHALLGAVPEVAGLWVACGFSGHGVMHAPSTGRILADLVLHGRCDAIDWAALSLDRIRTGALLHETAVF